MDATTTAGHAAAVFEEHRTRLTRLAYRMLGSWAEAEDAVQEAWLRFAAAGGPGADVPATATGRAPDTPGRDGAGADVPATATGRAPDTPGRDGAGSTPGGTVAAPGAWLTTVVSRICLDVLRSARVRREGYPGPWLPEPLVARLPSGDPDPAEQAAERDEVSIALLTVMERLTPEQRVAFVLHDAFAVPFDRVAEVLGVSAAAARQLASRGRRAVGGAAPAPHRVPLAQQRALLDAFLAAARGGDLDGLLRLLAPGVQVIGDGGGIAPASRAPITGADKAARFLLGLLRRSDQQWALTMEWVLVNGDLGLLFHAVPRDGGRIPTPAGAPELPGGTLRGVLAFAIDPDGRISGIYNQLNPAKLGRIPAP